MREKCSHPLHDHPLASGYVAAHEEAEVRLASGWKNIKCAFCELYGWEQPAAAAAEEGK